MGTYGAGQAFDLFVIGELSEKDRRKIMDAINSATKGEYTYTEMKKMSDTNLQKLYKRVCG